MTNEQLLKNLTHPVGVVDAVIDTDAYNEVDDQFAISYLLRSKEKINTVALYAAPYSFPGKVDTATGMQMSYNEILKLLALAGESDKPAYRGSVRYLTDESTPVVSDAARDLAERVESYSTERPLYIIAIGALTNVASAILLNPEIKERAVVVWLGGHGHDLGWTDEFNMRQDMHATRIVMGCGIPLVQIPCECVANAFSISKPELENYLVGSSPLADYLAKNVLNAQGGTDKCWARVLWDVVAVGWLVGGDRFTISRVMPTWLPSDDFQYIPSETSHPQRYICWVNRSELMTDLIEKLRRS